MDKLIITPDSDGYSFADGPEVIRSQLDGGAGRYRSYILNSAVQLNVQWTVNATEYEYLRTAYHTHVEEGHAPFQIDLIVDESELTEYWVKILPGSFGLSSVNGKTFVVKATLEVPLAPWTPTETPLPKFQLVPQFDSYSFTDSAEAEFTELDGGPSKMRRSQLGVSTQINVEFKCTAAQFVYFRNYYRDWVTKPRDGFLVDLLLDESTLTELTANFVPGSVQLGSQVGNLYVIKAKLEASDFEPLEPPDDLPLWLDTFTGSEGIVVTSHDQDVPLNGSVWIANSPFSTVPPELDGEGSASAVASEGGYESNAYTVFSDALLLYPFTLNIEFTALARKPDLEFNGYDSLFVLDMDGQYFSVQWTAGVQTLETDPVLQIGFEFDSLTLTNTSTGLNTVSVFFEEDGWTVTFNGVTSEKYEYDTPNVISRFLMTLGSTSSEGMRIAPFSTISRAEIIGELQTGGPWLFYPTETVEGDITESRAPIHKYTYQYIAITQEPEPHVPGFGVTDEDGDGGDNVNSVSDVVIPLYSESPTPIEGEYLWEPADPESSVVPVLSASDPSGGTWTGGPTPPNLFVSLSASGGPLIGWAGGVLTLYANNDPGTGMPTIITFLPSSFVYPPVSVYYGPLA